MFVSSPFLKIGLSCASALLLVTANASAHGSGKGETQSFRIAEAELDLVLDLRYLKSQGVENFGDLSSFDQIGSGQDDSFGWEDTDHSGKSSKGDRDFRFSFGWHEGGHFDFGDSRHDGHGHGHDHDRGDNWGDGWFGGACNGGGDPTCGGNPTCGGGDPNGGGDPGGSATPEPRASVLSVIAAGAMALLLVGRNVRRRGGASRG